MMCMMPQGKTSSVGLDPIEALAGKGITTKEATFQTNRPSKIRKVKKSLRINKPSK